MKIAIISSVPKHERELALIQEGLEMVDAQFCAQPIDPFTGEAFVPAIFRVLAPGEPCPTDEIPYHIDATTGIDSAAAYHDKYGDGRPYSIAGLDAANGEWLSGDGDSVLELLQHEHFELRGNPRVNRWVQSNYLDKKTGRVYPLVCPERSDPVQGIYDKMKLRDGTMVGRVAFVYASFFNQERVQCEQLDSHGACSEPLVTLPGGYQIAAVMGREVSVFGARSARPGRVEIIEHHERGLTEIQRVRKLRPTSRTMRIVNTVV